LLRRPEIGFVDERGGLQRLPRPFARQVEPRNATEFVVDGGTETRENAEARLAESGSCPFSAAGSRSGPAESAASPGNSYGMRGLFSLLTPEDISPNSLAAGVAPRAAPDSRAAFK